jgi:hypothetical protein
LSLLHSVQTGSGPHPASYPINTGGLFPWWYSARGVKLTTHFHLVRSVFMTWYRDNLIYGNVSSITYAGHAIAPSVGRRPGFDTRSGLAGFWGDKMAPGRIFSPSNLISPAKLRSTFCFTFINHLITRRCVVPLLTAPLNKENK